MPQTDHRTRKPFKTDEICMVETMEIPKGFKQTEVGVIPSDWEVTTIDKISEVKSGKRLPLGKLLVNRETSHPYVRVADMFMGGVSLDDIKYVPDDVYPSIKNYCIFVDDIFISVAGTLGLVGKIPSELEGANLTENADRLTKISCNRDYLLYTLMSWLIQNKIGAEKTLGAQPKLALTRIRKFFLPLPPTKAEQTAIATVLNDADALITQLEKLIAKKRAIKQGAMQELLKPKEGWEMKRLGELFDLNPSKPVIKKEDVVTFLGMEDVSGNGMIINQYLLPFSQIKKGLTFFKKNDVLVAKITPCFENGKGACLDRIETENGFGSTEFHVLRANDNSVPRFIFYHTQTQRFRKQLESEMTGTAGQKRIPSKSIVNFQIFVPNVEEQTHIAKILSDMDTEIEALEKKLDKYKKIKQGMMQTLLTGRIRLV